MVVYVRVKSSSSHLAGIIQGEEFPLNTRDLGANARITGLVIRLGVIDAKLDELDENALVSICAKQARWMRGSKAMVVADLGD